MSVSDPLIAVVEVQQGVEIVTVVTREVEVVAVGAQGPPGATGPPGPAGPPGSGVLIRESLTGAVDGSNTIFFTSAPMQAGTSQVYLNGLLLTDYVEGTSGVTLDDPPTPGDRLTIIYFS